MLKKILVGLVSVLLLSACSKDKGDDDVLAIYQNMPESTLYQQAVTATQTKDYSTAIKRFEAFDTLYPFSPHGRQAQLYLIYAYFENADYGLSAAASERFMHLYPRDKDVDYTYYMKGVANFEQQRGTLSQFFKIDHAWRAPGTQLEAYHDFEALIKKFPQSRYYSDSLKRMIYLRNQFAQQELHIANFYMERKRYVAALERARYVIKHYNQAPQAKQALMLADKINKILSFNKSAQDDRKILKDTYV